MCLLTGLDPTANTPQRDMAEAARAQQQKQGAAPEGSDAEEGEGEGEEEEEENAAVEIEEGVTTSSLGGAAAAAASSRGVHQRAGSIGGGGTGSGGSGKKTKKKAAAAASSSHGKPPPAPLAAVGAARGGPGAAGGPHYHPPPPQGEDAALGSHIALIALSVFLGYLLNLSLKYLELNREFLRNHHLISVRPCLALPCFVLSSLVRPCSGSSFVLLCRALSCCAVQCRGRLWSSPVLTSRPRHLFRWRSINHPKTC